MGTTTDKLPHQFVICDECGAGFFPHRHQPVQPRFELVPGTTVPYPQGDRFDLPPIAYEVTRPERRRH